MNKSLEGRIEALEQRLGTHRLEVWLCQVRPGTLEADYRFGGLQGGPMIEREPRETLDAFQERIRVAFPPKRTGDVAVYRLRRESL